MNLNKRTFIRHLTLAAGLGAFSLAGMAAEEARDAPGQNLAPNLDEERLRIFFLRGGRGNPLRFLFADLKRGAIGIELGRGIDLELNGAVVGQAAQVGEDHGGVGTALGRGEEKRAGEADQEERDDGNEGPCPSGKHFE